MILFNRWKDEHFGGILPKSARTMSQSVNCHLLGAYYAPGTVQYNQQTLQEPAEASFNDQYTCSEILEL